MRSWNLLFFSLLVTGNFTWAQTCPADLQRSTPNEDFECGNGVSWHTCNPWSAGDDQVRDNRTGLIWKRCPEGMSFNASTGCSGVSTDLAWQSALITGAIAWRLPNYKELLSISDTGCFDPAINLSVFPGTPAAGFWSASPSYSLGEIFGKNADCVDFSWGYSCTALKTLNLKARYVRSEP